ncbi:YaeQ family protein [Paraglaciecola aquimarina]|uniref:YaeQ family protein n=1 Tax=Paraglaciecola aquimarina TaxID=1235557 RepID=A0ABU3SWW6_9ALTE|nr:YaeQ family protein [Paraglaciecola aquimarina]MDU0354505.1 YaeQ family protein [Paraglaciecola aquimarina]
MALKPTIYKFKISLSDLNNDHFDSLNLTIAQHPSETLARMMARVMAFCLHAHQDKEQLLTFTKGLSAVEEPDIWLKGLDDQLHMWIDIGEPAFERMKKATRLAKSTYVYSFNAKSDVWWKQAQAQFDGLDISVVRFNWDEVQGLSALVSRTVELSVTISGESAYVAGPVDQVEVNWQVLQSN